MTRTNERNVKRPGTEPDAVILKEKLDSYVDGTYRDFTPGLVASVYRSGKEIYRNAVGEIRDLGFTFTYDTIFDLASLTKPVVTATLAAKALQDNTIGLDDTIEVLGFHPEYANIKKFTVRSLLTHSSGMRPHYPLYTIGRDRESYLRGIEVIAGGAEIYSKEEYSDLNFILLGFLLEQLYSKSLDILAKKFIFDPLGMKDTSFRPVPDRKRIAPSEKTADRGLVWGEIHDENSYYLGGVSGHAGLFSTAGDLAKFMSGLLSGKILSRKTLDLMNQPWNNYLGGTFGLGWMIKLPRPKDPSPAFGFSAFIGDYADYGTMGHTGFTGTSLVLDAKREIFVILLTNRVYPTRENNGILRFRRLFHNIIFSNLS